MRKCFFLVLLMIFSFGGALAQSPPTLRIVTETPGLPSDLFYGDIKVKPLRLRPGTNTPITIDDADFFAAQHYIDFLRRFPDAPGLAHWTAEITDCNDPAKRQPGELRTAVRLSYGFTGAHWVNNRAHSVRAFRPDLAAASAGLFIAPISRMWLR